MNVKKEVRGAAGETKAETATRDAGVAAEASTKKTYTEAEKKACSIEAMRNGEICEACQ